MEEQQVDERRRWMFVCMKAVSIPKIFHNDTTGRVSQLARKEDHGPTCSAQLRWLVYARFFPYNGGLGQFSSSSILTELLCRHLPTTIFRIYLDVTNPDRWIFSHTPPLTGFTCTTIVFVSSLSENNNKTSHIKHSKLLGEVCSKWNSYMFEKLDCQK